MTTPIERYRTKWREMHVEPGDIPQQCLNDLFELAEDYIRNAEGNVNYTTASCGHPTIAVGAPGSITRKECENNPCDRCRADAAEKCLASWEWVAERRLHVRWLAITGLPNWICEDADGETIGSGYSAESAIENARRAVEQHDAGFTDTAT